MNNEVNNEINNTGTTVDQTPTPVESVTPVATPVEPTPVEVPPVVEPTPAEVSAPVEAAPAEVAPTPVVETPAPAEPVAETPAEPRLVQIKPSIGGGSLTPDSSNANIQVVAKKQSIIPVIVLIVGLIGLAISGYWLYNELNKKDDTTKTPSSERLPFSGAFNSKVTTPATTNTDSETNTDENTTTEATLTYPDFTGKTIEEAKNWCVEQNIEMKIEYVYADNVPSGSIIKQSGEVGTKVDTNGEFTIYVTN